MAVPAGKTIICNIFRPTFRNFSSTPVQSPGTVKFENSIISQSESKAATISRESQSSDQPQSLPEAHLFGLGALPLDKTASTSTAYTDIERWGHDGAGGRNGIVGYDIFQELEERLQEVRSRGHVGSGPGSMIKEKEEVQNGAGEGADRPEKGAEKIKKVNKMSAALESINRFLSFYLFRSTLYPKRW